MFRATEGFRPGRRPVEVIASFGVDSLLRLVVYQVVSKYWHFTDACGHNKPEIFLCLELQRSSYFTLPQVASTLQQLYGIPDQFVNNMIAKVDTKHPLKLDQLETLVSFRLVVQPELMWKLEGGRH